MTRGQYYGLQSGHRESVVSRHGDPHHHSGTNARLRLRAHGGHCHAGASGEEEVHDVGVMLGHHAAGQLETMHWKSAKNLSG